MRKLIGTRMVSGRPALHDMTNMTNLEAIPKFVRSRDQNKSTNPTQSHYHIAIMLRIEA